MIRLQVRGGAGFDKLQRQLSRVASRDAYAAVKKSIAAEAITQVALGFRNERDPYGDGWMPLKRRRGRILSKTGRLRRSFTAHVTSDGFKIGSSAHYSAFHQYGTRRGLPARPMLPLKARGLGDWREPLRKAATVTLRRLLKR